MLPHAVVLALQELCPGSFDQVVRVCNHRQVDKLLVKHDEALTRRERAAAAVAALRLRLKAAAATGAQPEGAASGSACPDGRAESDTLCKLSLAAAPAAALPEGHAGQGEAAVVGAAAGTACTETAARLAKAEAELAKYEQQVAELEAVIVQARKHALARPLGTAFIALFR